MKRNIGSADKAIRVILAFLFATFYFTNVVTGLWGIVLLIVAIVLLLTAIINFCPLWALFGINTTKVETE
jgi:hypothetical protein